MALAGASIAIFAAGDGDGRAALADAFCAVACGWFATGFGVGNAFGSACGTSVVEVGPLLLATFDAVGGVSF